jgi:hypothetical protein
MPTPDTPNPRVEIVLGALLYLMTAYRRKPCARIAGCVARHLERLAGHPDADPAIRELCAEMYDEWRSSAAPTLPRRDVH